MSAHQPFAKYSIELHEPITQREGWVAAGTALCSECDFQTGDNRFLPELSHLAPETRTMYESTYFTKAYDLVTRNLHREMLGHILSLHPKRTIDEGCVN